MALASAVAVLAIERWIPVGRLTPVVSGFLEQIDFDATLVRGLLCFLLFAGALHVDLEGLLASAARSKRRRQTRGVTGR